MILKDAQTEKVKNKAQNTFVHDCILVTQIRYGFIGIIYSYYHECYIQLFSIYSCNVKCFCLALCKESVILGF